MKLRHAVALALTGWCLLLPPTQEALDSACRFTHSTFFGDIKVLLRGGNDANAVQCDLESLQLDTSAPLSKWECAGVFETLPECKAQQGKPLTESEKRSEEGFARRAFDEDHTRRAKYAELLPADFVKLFIETRQTAVYASQCIGTDDPRLAK